MTGVSNAASTTAPTATGLVSTGQPDALASYSFFQALRTIERRRTWLPRLGYALRPADEPVRISQPAELTFAPAALTGQRPLRVTSEDPYENREPAVLGNASENSIDCQRADEAKAALQPLPPVEIPQRFLGLLGPGGPLPLHITEIVRERQRHSGDPSLQAFLDIFHHRMAMLFYRSWSDATPVVQHDRPDDDRFARQLGSLIGIGTARSQLRDRCPDAFKLRCASQLAGIHRNAEGLEALIYHGLKVQARVSSFALRTLTLPFSQRTALVSHGIQSNRNHNCLGRSAQLGQSVPDRSSMIDIHIGPVDYDTFDQLLPCKPIRQGLIAAVRNYIGPATDARVSVGLKKDHIPSLALGRSGQLGRTCWLNSKATARDRFDFRFEISGCFIEDDSAGDARCDSNQGMQA